MDELRGLIRQYDSYYDMADDNATWRRGAAVDHRVRELVKRLRGQGHGADLDAMMIQHPGVISCPGGVHALA